ncbi:MAG: cysteine desulfurase family protein, partial [Limisphaerales bacterium]
MIYFDHNATTPLHPAAREAWLKAVDCYPANPASQHRMGQRAEAALAEATARFARFLGCAPEQILWTSGATESSNAVFHHLSRCNDEKGEIWISSVEHAAVLQPASAYFARQLRKIPVSPGGVISLEWLENELKHQRPGLIAVMAANNETGVLQPWREVSQLCREHEVPLLCDATQWLGKLPGADLGQVDYVIGSAHKFGGPRGIGFLKQPRSESVSALISGGQQQHGQRG